MIVRLTKAKKYVIIIAIDVNFIYVRQNSLMPHKIDRGAFPIIMRGAAAGHEFISSPQRKARNAEESRCAAHVFSGLLF